MYFNRNIGLPFVHIQMLFSKVDVTCSWHCMFSFVSQKDPGLGDATYELCYNNACYYIGRNDYKTAEDKLRKAECMLIIAATSVTS